jgi:fructose-bisphosphate aldolase class 1
MRVIQPCNKRFAEWGTPQNAETRRNCRDMIVPTPALGESISGSISTTKLLLQSCAGTPGGLDIGIPYGRRAPT